MLLTNEMIISTIDSTSELIAKANETIMKISITIETICPISFTMILNEVIITNRIERALARALPLCCQPRVHFRTRVVRSGTERNIIPQISANFPAGTFERYLNGLNTGDRQLQSEFSAQGLQI